MGFPGCSQDRLPDVPAGAGRLAGMDSSNPHSGDQDSATPRDGGQFWPPGRWRRPTQVAVGLGVAAAVLAGGIITAVVTAAGSPAPAAASTLAAGSGPIDADTAQLLTVLGLGGPPGAILAGPGGAIAAGPGGAVVTGPAGEVVAGPGAPLAALRCVPPGFQIARPGPLHGHVQRVIKGRVARIQREIRIAVSPECAQASGCRARPRCTVRSPSRPGTARPRPRSSSAA